MRNLYKKIIDAASSIQPYIYQTALEKSHYLSDLLDANVFLKLEHCQITGSFKIRGALNKVLSLSTKERDKGVVCASAGNHGIGVSQAGAWLGTQVSVFLPNSVDSARLKKIEALGARVHQVEGECEEAEKQARLYADEHHITYISPYNDMDVIAGQGTIGLEIQAQLNQVDQCYVAVGGGGLISGTACALKTAQPKCVVYGVSPKNSCVMAEAFHSNHIQPDKHLQTLSDSTAGGLEPDSVTLPLSQQWVNDFILISEEEIKHGMCVIAEYEGWMIEGAAALGVAAALKNKNKLKDKTIVIVLCGRNIALNRYSQII